MKANKTKDEKWVKIKEVGSFAILIKVSLLIAQSFFIAMLDDLLARTQSPQQPRRQVHSQQQWLGWQQPRPWPPVQEHPRGGPPMRIPGVLLQRNATLLTEDSPLKEKKEVGSTFSRGGKMTMDLDEEMTLYLYVTITTFINKLIQLSSWSLGCSTILFLSFWSSFGVRRRCSKRIFSIRWLHTWINWNVHKKTEGAWIICGTYPLSPVFLLVFWLRVVNWKNVFVFV